MKALCPTPLLVIAVIVLFIPAAADTEPLPVDEPSVEQGDCCNCRFSAVEQFSASEGLPCDFDHPAGWEALYDVYGLSAVVGKPSCETPCTATSAIAFTVAEKPNTNAETMEEIWRQALRVVGTASCGGQEVTFFSLPGSEPLGLTGGLRFHVGHGGKKYGANATFSCPEPGAWLDLQELFINTLRTNRDTTFEGG